MLTSRESAAGCGRAKGSARASLAELRRQLSEPEALSDAGRQRLSELAERLARVRALGGEYVRVDLSQRAVKALGAVTA